ncbi:MAG TPA: hypothetical protein VH092_12940 [Urbifossiella sp.]|jgi:hypothetical protein|nr:hypothetical protein [Urbifossiella sp.]
MTLSETLLPKLSDWRPAGAGRHSWTHSAAGWAVQLTADKADSLSCLVWELALARTDPAPAGLTLKTWADGVAARVGGLMEPLVVHEIDAARDEAVLRSTAPTARADALAYYEVVLHGTDRAVVRRFHGSKAKPGREQVPFALTHEVLAKLADDITG